METKQSNSTTVDNTKDPKLNDPRLNIVIVDKKLYNILSTVVPISPVTTLSNLLDSLKFYIFQKQLFDPLEPTKLCLKSDELASVFGVSDCFIADVIRYIPKIVCPITDKHAGADFLAYQPNGFGGCKRKIENVNRVAGSIFCSQKNSVATETSTIDVLSTDEIHSKKAKTECIFLEIPSSPSRISTSSPPESIQDYETSIVKDTSDEDDNFSIIAVEETYDLEYEISSDFSVSDSNDSDDETIFSNTDALNSIFHFICESDTDIEYLADQSEDADDEISESDQWQCTECSYNRNSPFARSCHRCFQIRTGWLSPAREYNKRQHRRCRSKRKRTPKIEKNSVIHEDVDKERVSSTSKQNYLSCDSIISSSSQENSTVTHSKCNTLVSEKKFPNCFLCCDQPLNGMIIHRNSKFAHTVSCYNCAIKLQNKNQKCPICRQKIDRVVYSVLSY